MEELRRGGVEVIFLNSPRGETAEDELLLQFQGMIAEYERAQITERCRRGKIHRARSGDVSVLSGAPYGYLYVRKTDSCTAYYEVIDSQAQVVRDVFRLYTQEDFSLGRITRHLSDEGIATRTGKTRWDRSTVWGMLRNPAYMGQAAFAKTRVVDRPKKLMRGKRQQGKVPRPGPAHEDRPQEQWISIPVPAIIDVGDLLAGRRANREKQALRHSAHAGAHAAPGPHRMSAVQLFVLSDVDKDLEAQDILLPMSGLGRLSLRAWTAVLEHPGPSGLP